MIHRVWCSKCAWREDVLLPSTIEGVEDREVLQQVVARHKQRRCNGVVRCAFPSGEGRPLELPL